MRLRNKLIIVGLAAGLTFTKCRELHANLDGHIASIISNIAYQSELVTQGIDAFKGDSIRINGCPLEVMVIRPDYLPANHFKREDTNLRGNPAFDEYCERILRVDENRALFLKHGAKKYPDNRNVLGRLYLGDSLYVPDLDNDRNKKLHDY